MSIPRTILAPGTLVDLDLECIEGAVPPGPSGEVFINASGRRRPDGRAQATVTSAQPIDRDRRPLSSRATAQ
jgi:hypothetical protein